MNRSNFREMPSRRPASAPAQASGEAEVKRYKDYKDYRIWQIGIEIVDAVYSVTHGFPREEIEGLATQMRKAAVSIPSDVAEGFVRKKEYVEFLYAALGSCARLDTQLYITGKRKYLAEAKIGDISQMLTEERKMLIGLIRAIQRNQNGDFRPRQQPVEQPAPF